MRRLLAGLASITLSACGSGERFEGKYQSVEEQFQGIDLNWLEQTLETADEDGLLLLTSQGALYPIPANGTPGEPVWMNEISDIGLVRGGYQDLRERPEWQGLGRPLLILPVDANALWLRKTEAICASMTGTEEMLFILWGGNDLHSQVTRCWSSHCADYPAIGIDLLVQSGASSSSAWHFRWGNPYGRYTWQDGEVPTEAPYPYTEVETAEELVAQLQSRFPPEKVVHFRPADDQPVSEVLRLKRAFHEAGFLYVDLE